MCWFWPAAKLAHKGLKGGKRKYQCVSFLCDMSLDECIYLGSGRNIWFISAFYKTMQIFS